MPNLSVTLDQRLLDAGKIYAEKHQMTMDDLIEDLLKQAVENESAEWLDICFRKMDQLNVNSTGRKWTRAELYGI